MTTRRFANHKGKGCTFPGCGRKNFSNGLCAAHNMQKRRGVELRPIRQARPKPQDGMVWCSTCKQSKDPDDFGWDVTRNQPKRQCRDCARETYHKHLDENRDAINLRVTLRKWGLTEDQYSALHEAQDHHCAICGAERREMRALSIDHCHKTGRIRGLLCQDCNLGMGQFEDDPELLLRAVAYLQAGGVVHDDTLRIPVGGEVDRRTRKRDAERARRRAGLEG